MVWATGWRGNLFAAMEWRRDPTGDPDGVGALLQRLDHELGGPPARGSRFVHDADTMLAMAREIEARATGMATQLHVGFQRAARLDAERDTYAAILAHGTAVTAFGVGQPAQPPPGVRWVSLPADPAALANQWFLVTREPEPVACVAFETSPAPHGLGRATAPGRTWEGFASRDVRVVDALLDHLEQVAATRLTSA